MKLKFTKMHGLGNDFIVLDGVRQEIVLNADLIASLAHRHTGVGFDQCLLIEPGQKEGVDFNYRIFNADGHEVGQCGNGARCLALFAQYYGLTDKNKLTIATKTRQMNLTINPDHSVSVDMGIPQRQPAAIPFIAEQEADEYQLELNEGTQRIHVINVGNPHAVLLVPDVETAPVSTLGPQISQHPRFPEQSNAGFMQVMTPSHIKLRVYERGSGETMACGSGAVAAAAVGRLYHHMDKDIKVALPGGELLIHWPDTQGNITLTGPACFVYEGSLLI